MKLRFLGSSQRQEEFVGRLQDTLSRLRKFGSRSAWIFAGGMIGALLLANAAQADRLREGIRAFLAHNYVRAAEIFTELAPQGDPIAQTYLGYMYSSGKGVPQDYTVSAGWYSCASKQGVARAQYELGLMYDRAHGVPQDYVRAYAFINLAVAKAGPERDAWTRVRDAVFSKLSLEQRTVAQQMSFEGVPETPCLPIVTGVPPPYSIAYPRLLDPIPW
ncbi:MAG: sel1 repeat family protein [Alphaproteobacteria bacterium]|nr:sel1 repeat family protein [Alphaproteobacteria bacterium]